jgi:hypothetical protein
MQNLFTKRNRHRAQFIAKNNPKLRLMYHIRELQNASRFASAYQDKL